MPTFTPRLAVVLVALSAIGGTVPLAAQGTPAMATIYLKEGGVIQGQILNENDPNGVRVKSAKSGTNFVLKTVWIDSIVKAPTAPPAPAPAVHRSGRDRSRRAVAAPLLLHPLPLRPAVAPSAPAPVPSAAIRTASAQARRRRLRWWTDSIRPRRRPQRAPAAPRRARAARRRSRRSSRTGMWVAVASAPTGDMGSEHRSSATAACWPTPRASAR